MKFESRLSLRGGSLLNVYVHWDNKSSLAAFGTFSTFPTMTTQIKNYPSEVVVAGDRPSAVLADQVKRLDWRKRQDNAGLAG